MTATPPPGQPATPAEALRWAAERWNREAIGINEWHTVGSLLVWANELDAAPAAPTWASSYQQGWNDAHKLLPARTSDPDPAAPATYALPAEPPPEVTELWDVEGERWERQHPGIDRWVADEKVWESVRTFGRLLPRGPLSTEADRDAD